MGQTPGDGEERREGRDAAKSLARNTKEGGATKGRKQAEQQVCGGTCSWQTRMEEITSDGV